MTKQEFTQELRNRLTGMPPGDIEERVSYYSEMIDDRMEDGLSEEDAVEGIGTVDSIVEHIMSEVPLTKLVREKAKPAKKHGAGWIALVILGAPLWLPLLIAAFAVVFALYIALWSVMIAFYAVVLALAVGAVVTLPAAGIYLSSGNPAGSLFSVGAGLILAGLAILFFIGCNAMAGGIVKLTGRALFGIKRSFIGKEA
ncbi:MAG: DUF1700 domain-containing protein [Lachnospiraceae bacterium]|nr:DUF1700 domain-containing protein [Lachnospiraceae bacterium]